MRLRKQVEAQRSTSLDLIRIRIVATARFHVHSNLRHRHRQENESGKIAGIVVRLQILWTVVALRVRDRIDHLLHGQVGARVRQRTERRRL